MTIAIELSILVVLVGAIVEAMKIVGMQTKYAPIVAIALGVVLNLIFFSVGEELSGALFAGLVVGTMASGLYDNIKTANQALKLREIIEK